MVVRDTTRLTARTVGRFLDLARTAQRGTGTGIAALAAAAGYADQLQLTR